MSARLSFKHVSFSFTLKATLYRIYIRIYIYMSHLLVIYMLILGYKPRTLGPELQPVARICLGSQHGTCVMSSFWRLEFLGDSVVGIATHYGWEGRMPVRARISGPSGPPPRSPPGSSLGTKPSKRGIDYTLPSSAGLRMGWSSNSVSPLRLHMHVMSWTSRFTNLYALYLIACHIKTTVHPHNTLVILRLATAAE